MKSNCIYIFIYSRSYSPYYASRAYGAYPVHHAIGKRSADAEAAPEADADAWYGNYGYAAASPAYYGGYRNYGYNTYSAAVPAVRSYNTVAGYASYAPYAATRAYAAYPATYGYGHAIGKRSADAEAAPEADADAWYGNYGYAAASPAYGYSAYAAPAVSYAAAPVSAYRYAAATPAYGYRAASYAPYAARSYGYAARSYGLW